jgi:uncharacterized protein (TIGR02145 family)
MFSIIQKGIGTPISFSEDYGLIPVCEDGDTFTDPRDGQVYNIVRIGNQVWFAQNLNYATENSICLFDDPDNCEKYGKLYRWYEKGEFCPGGWHVPSNEDWEILFEHLGGKDVAGGKMKSITGWEDPNIGATNESGFNGLPAAVDYFDFEPPYTLIGRWWSSSSKEYYDGDEFIYWVELVSELPSVKFGGTETYDGYYSCRCVRD